MLFNNILHAINMFFFNVCGKWSVLALKKAAVEFNGLWKSRINWNKLEREKNVILELFLEPHF